MEGAAGDLCRRIDETGQLPQEDIQTILDLARAFLADDRAGWSDQNAG